MFLKKCRVCENKNLTPFFDLGLQPLANSLLTKIDEKEKHYPLALVWCADCNLVQLNYTVDPKKLFSHYFWVTGTSRAAREFALVFFDRLINRCPNSKNDYVLELASNDGTFLQPFLNSGYRVLGVDPAANVVKIARKNNIPTEKLFWGKRTARRILRKYGQARIIFARNVLAHVADTRDFINGVAACLHNDGIFAAEVHYATNILTGLQYDSIYHEHLCYFTLKPLERLLNNFGLFIFDIQASPISGGAMVVYARKRPALASPMLKKYRLQENSSRINEFKNWSKFAKLCFNHHRQFIALLKKFKVKYRNIAAWGASARSSTLLNFCRINSKTIPIIADQNPLKHRHFTAGTRILIEEPVVVMKKNPQAMIILAWNLGQEIIDSLRHEYQFKGPCLLPLPDKPRIVKL